MNDPKWQRAAVKCLLAMLTQFPLAFVRKQPPITHGLGEKASMGDGSSASMSRLAVRILTLLFTFTVSGCFLFVDTRAPRQYFSVQPVEPRSESRTADLAWIITTILESEHYGCRPSPALRPGSYWCNHSQSDLFLEYEIVGERASFAIQPTRLAALPSLSRRRMTRHLESLADSFEAANLSYVETSQR